MITTPAALNWTPPGPGPWTLAADHYPRPVTASMEPFAQVWSEATEAYLRRLGLPIDTARMELVNGFPYMNFGSASKPPPAWMMRVLVRLLPSLRKAEADAAKVLAERPWVDEANRWYAHERTPAVDRMSALTRIDPAALDDGQLAGHLRDCERNFFDSARQHLLLHGCDTPPVALFAARVLDWGATVQESLSLLAGSSPASTAATDELLALRNAVAGTQITDPDDIRTLGPEAAEALDHFLERHGWRVVDGYDVDCVCLIEVPGLIVELATAPDRTASPEDVSARADALRRRVPAAERAEFDEMLRDARLAYGVRDDNSGILIAWPIGLLRRAMLATGQRIAKRNGLTDPSLAIEARVGELVAALTGEASLDGAGLADRATYRQALRSSDAPRSLGPPEPPLPLDWPGALGLMMRAIALTDGGPGPEDRPLQGLGIGDRAHEGTARLLTGAGKGFDRFEPGDVLVAPMTSPSYNVVIALAGALVTEEGDGMSHAAIMARELGIPADVGARFATRELRDGDRVVVDPTEGTVRVLTGSQAETAEVL